MVRTFPLYFLLLGLSVCPKCLGKHSTTLTIFASAHPNSKEQVPTLPLKQNHLEQDERLYFARFRQVYQVAVHVGKAVFQEQLHQGLLKAGVMSPANASRARIASRSTQALKQLSKTNLLQLQRVNPIRVPSNFRVCHNHLINLLKAANTARNQTAILKQTKAFYMSWVGVKVNINLRKK